jgi:GH35 family endo-1,4-beta-xylanase
MKLNRIIIPVTALTLALSGCYDEKMEWGRPDGYGDVSISDMPLELAEKLANYDYIKNYAAKYASEMTVGLGLGADLYISDEDYRTVADNNFQMFTTGNAMKHSSVVKNDGSLDFTTIDKFLALVPADILIYGHNFLWHTQQQQTYLKSLLAPEIKVETSDDDVCENILPGTSSDFEGGSTGGWGSWGSNKESVTVEDGAGYNGTAGAVLKNGGDGNAWEAQFAYTFDTALDPNTTYVITFKAKSSINGGQLQFQYQNSSTYSSQGGYNTFELTTAWLDYKFEFTPAYDDVNRIILNFGKVGATYYLDNIKFGKKIEETFTNILGDNGKFEDGNTGGWGSWGSGKDSDGTGIQEGVGYNDSDCMVLKNTGDGNAWNAQFAYTFDDPLSQSNTYVIQFYARCLTGVGQLQFQYQNSSTYSSQGGYNTFDISTTWIKYEYEFTPAYDDVNRIIFNFGAVGDTYYIDNIKFGPKKESSSVRKSSAPQTRAGGITYIFKTAEEKRTALLGAMENWIKGMYEHLDGRVLYYDVINEPIADNLQWRGVDGNFSGDDTAPVEDPDSGLNLNWESDHFYWGYFIGKDYGVKAFEYARKYAPAGSKLFVNDYGLESNPKKLAALIEFINYIEQNGQTVDGIGTQMHVSKSITRAEIDAMFKTLAATGKLVRVTELDVSLGTSTPSTEELATQAEIYQEIFDSYRENVPQAQRSGITLWTLTDNSREHEYWLPDDAPNVFDAKYGRKHAYKGVCDGIAGYDISTDFDGTYWNSGN